jgi:hypothetical protein
VQEHSVATDTEDDLSVDLVIGNGFAAWTKGDLFGIARRIVGGRKVVVAILISVEGGFVLQG